MLQFVDRDTYKNAIINPERAFLLYVDNENKISLQADIDWAAILLTTELS